MDAGIHKEYMYDAESNKKKETAEWLIRINGT